MTQSPNITKEKSMPRRAAKRGLAELTQTGATWHVALQQLRMWVEGEEGTPIRPWMLLVLDLDRQLLQHTTILPGRPDGSSLADFLAEAMRRRDAAVGVKPHRPAVIQLEEATWIELLEPQLAHLQIRTVQAPRPNAVNALLDGLEDHLREGAEPKGLLAGRGVKPPLVGAFFAAAAAFYRAAVWEQLSDRDVLAVEAAGRGPKRFVVVMGGGGVEYGLAVYEQWADLERLFTPALDPTTLIPAKGAHALYYNDITSLPFADLDAIEEHGWEIAGEQAYPVPVILNRKGEVRRPQRQELQWYEATLLALPQFVHKHLPAVAPDPANPVEALIPVTTSDGEVQVRITYPGGVLPAPEEAPTHLLDWLGLDEAEDDEQLAVPDRRALEASFGGVMGGRGGKAVDQAQEIMYEAWDAPNPAQRIALAHQALGVSRDCADAYVLLAEEEAKTVGESLSYYEAGVAAGERALGKRFFKENAGYFWGLIETRPYMRARQGLANTLWQIGRHAEAEGHYRELLRLNPGDNQGIRYSLLNLLLEAEHDDQARALLAEHAEDGMAEWLYTRALLAFRQGGPTSEANRALQEAVKTNPHVPAYLTGKKKIPPRLPPYIGFGDQNEAIHYAAGYLTHWRKTPGAIDWLKRVAK
jgi:tetratricopeptide (TPR) repeat protein